MAAAGASLSGDGHLYYVGRDSFAVAALVDASECPPTYNAAFEDVRAFLHQGYSALQNVDGDMSGEGSQFRLRLGSPLSLSHELLSWQTRGSAGWHESDAI